MLPGPMLFVGLMIAYLEGRLTEAAPTRVVVDCGGVGYAVYIPVSSYDQLPRVGEPIKILTHHHVVAQEGTQQIYGFMNEDERSMFLMLIAISGIGPRAALNILSTTSITALRSAIVNGDTGLLSSLRGIGKKTAERLVVELREKLGGDQGLVPDNAAGLADPHVFGDAVAALVSLGYKQADAHKVITRAATQRGPKATVEELVRGALHTP